MRISAACSPCSTAMRRQFPQFRHALELEPRLPLTQKKLGQALAELGRGNEADEAFEEFFELDPSKGEVALAMDHLRAGRKTEADRGAARAPARASRQRGRDACPRRHLLSATGERLGDAEALLRRATRLAPGFAAAWILLGTLLQDADRYTDAIECFRQVIANEPDNAPAWTGLANASAQAGRVEESAAAFVKAIELNPNVPGSHRPGPRPRTQDSR